MHQPALTMKNKKLKDRIEKAKSLTMKKSRKAFLAGTPQNKNENDHLNQVKNFNMIIN